jgi:integrase
MSGPIFERLQRPSTAGWPTMRVDLKGIHKVRRKLADGSHRIHYYAWRGGPRLDGAPHSPEFLASFSAAHALRKKPTGDNIRTLIADFQASAPYLALSVRTRGDYDGYLSVIEAEFGEMPLAAMSDPRVRGIFLRWRDKRASNPRAADYGMTVLARLLAWGKDRGAIGSNPCERPGRVYRVNRSEAVWSDADIDRFNAVASVPLKNALLLALWTGQRQGDLLRLSWTAYDGKHLRLRQSKSGVVVHIPVAKVLAHQLRAMRRRRVATTILTNSRGQPWTESGFRASWRTASQKAKIVGLRFHDLRGSAVSRLAQAGATVPEIAAITGHSLSGVTNMVDRYLNRSAELAGNGMAKLEKNGTHTKTVNRPVNRPRSQFDGGS